MTDTNPGRISDIRHRVCMGGYSRESLEDICFLLDLLDRREMKKPSALNYLREVLDAGNYPALSDVRALIDELEATRADRIKDLEEIEQQLSATISECKLTRFVRARLERLRNPSQPRTVEILDALIQTLENRVAVAPVGSRAAGLREAVNIIRNKRKMLDDTVVPNEH